MLFLHVLRTLANRPLTVFVWDGQDSKYLYFTGYPVGEFDDSLRSISNLRSSGRSRFIQSLYIVSWRTKASNDTWKTRISTIEGDSFQCYLTVLELQLFFGCGHCIVWVMTSKGLLIYINNNHMRILLYIVFVGTVKQVYSDGWKVVRNANKV